MELSFTVFTNFFSLSRTHPVPARYAIKFVPAVSSDVSDIPVDDASSVVIPLRDAGSVTSDFSDFSVLSSANFAISSANVVTAPSSCIGTS